MRVLMAQPRGFCAGVVRAIEIVERSLEKFGAPVYVRHEIVHNRHVVDALHNKGAVFVDALDEVPDGRPVVFSAHGVPKLIPANAEARGLDYLDATCPLVSKVHRQAERQVAAGRHILFIGHAGHPEVIGTLGQLPQGAISLVETVEDAEAFQRPGDAPLAYATQTTLSVDDTRHIVEALKPGVRENEIVALAAKKLYEYGSDQVEAINAISGERCSPHPHNFTDRLIRPGDQAFFDIIQSYMGYRTCYYRTFAVGSATSSQYDAYTKAREWMDAAIQAVHAGVGTDEIARVWPKATEPGFANELAAFGLQFGHGLGLGLHERPIISRLNSLDNPVEVKAGMVFALETYCPASDGFSAARIEEEVVVTETGVHILTKFPAQKLFIANEY